MCFWKDLTVFFSDNKDKLIAQAYDGASVLRGQKAGVQQKVREQFKNAHYVHSYGHQLNATSYFSGQESEDFFFRTERNCNLFFQVTEKNEHS